MGPSEGRRNSARARGFPGHVARAAMPTKPRRRQPVDEGQGVDFRAMEPFFSAAFAVVTLLGCALALAVLRRGGGDRPIDAATLGRAGWRVFQLQLVAILVLWPFGLHFFGVMNLAWLVLSVVLPFAGAALLVLRRRGRPVTRPACAAALLALLMIPLALEAQWRCPRDLRTERVDVPLDAVRAGTQPLRLAVLADLQATSIGAHEIEAVDRILAGEPDLILVPGDIYQGSAARFERELPAFQEQIRRLRAPGGVWVVPGNSDFHAGLPRLLEGSAARLLCDEVVHVTVKDRRVAIFGADERPHERNAQWRTHTPGLRAFAAAGDDETVRIVLAHRPRIVDELLPHSRVDLVVAGHTHGGQVALPFFGPPIVLSPLPRAIAAGGLHERAGHRVYVSRGVGMERKNAPRIRLLVPPEVTLLDLRDAP